MRDLKIVRRSVYSILTPIDPLDKARVNKKLDIDPFGTSQKLLNPCGFPMNDIMAFEHAQSESVARTILQRINVIKDTGMPSDSRSIDDHFAELCPANWSSPSEYVRYQKMVAENHYKRADSLASAASLAKKAAQDAAIKDAQVVNVNPE